MADVLNLFTGPCTLYVDGVNVGWTRGGIRMRVNKSLWGRPSFSGLGVEEIVKQSEDFYISTVLVETTIANLRQAWGINESAVGLKVNFGGSVTVPVHSLQFVAENAFFEAYFYRVVAVDFGEVNFAKTMDAFIPVTFRALLDTSKAVGSQIGYILRGPRGYSTVLMKVTVPKYKSSQIQARVTVYYTSTFKALISRVVTRKKSSSSLVVRLISRADSSKNLLIRLIVPKFGTSDLIFRLTVAFAPGTSNLISRVVALNETSKSLVCRLDSFGNGVNNLITRVTITS